MARGVTTWLITIIVLAVSGLMLSLLMVWLNIGRVDMGYTLKRLQTDYENKKTLGDKLRLERDNIISPYSLSGKASEFGLGPAKPGQIRRMGK